MINNKRLRGSLPSQKRLVWRWWGLGALVWPDEAGLEVGPGAVGVSPGAGWSWDCCLAGPCGPWEAGLQQVQPLQVHFALLPDQLP